MGEESLPVVLGAMVVLAVLVTGALALVGRAKRAKRMCGLEGALCPLCQSSEVAFGEEDGTYECRQCGFHRCPENDSITYRIEAVRLAVEKMRDLRRTLEARRDMAGSATTDSAGNVTGTVRPRLTPDEQLELEEGERLVEQLAEQRAHQGEGGGSAGLLELPAEAGMGRAIELAGELEAELEGRIEGLAEEARALSRPGPYR